MPNVAAYGIVLVQSLFFFLGGIRDNFMTGRVIMPDEEYLQSCMNICAPTAGPVFASARQHVSAVWWIDAHSRGRVVRC